MVLSQFDLIDALRCPATDEEGYRCAKPPSHAGGHAWARCDARDPEGHRCMLPPHHAGDHELPWYDRPASRGDSHTIRYRGTEARTSALAAAGARAFRRYGWIQKSCTFEPGRRWPWSDLSRSLAGGSSSAGRLTVVNAFEPPRRR